MTLPVPTSTEPARSRRAILAGALGGLAGLIGGRLARPDPTVAAAGGPVIMGAANSAGVTNTSLATTSTGTALQVTQSGSGTAFRGSAVGAGSIAGFFTANNGTGVSGVTGHLNSFGVFAQNNGAAGSGAAVRASGGNNHGLVATTSNATANAIRGINIAADGAGVVAEGFTGLHATGGDTGVLAIGDTFGVLGSANGAGVYGQAGTGVFGLGGGATGVGVHGDSNGPHGVVGESSDEGGFGVRGIADNGEGSVGVFGESVEGEGGHFTGAAFGVFAGGEDTGLFALGGVTGSLSQGGDVGLFAQGGGTGLTAVGTSIGIDATGATGIQVASSSTAGVFTSTGATGISASSSSAPIGLSSVGGRFVSTASDGAGVIGIAHFGNSAVGVLGTSLDGLAGAFVGDVDINGTLTKNAGSFVIDHPLDPANKTLAHSFVESPDMMNVYNGNVTTDGRGDATVLLPRYFEALNRDFRYQLTVIGEFAQAIIGSGVHNNRFTIRTDKPNVQVSWQVTGVRQDVYARAHPIIVESDKAGDRRGRYLSPKEHGKPASAGVYAERLARLDQQQPSVAPRPARPGTRAARHERPARVKAPDLSQPRVPGGETPLP